ncbi:hypothetical protein R3W88_002200 [Solanum pinnatisectum]|uniref:Uncharacterized protein n=1 Tax=Solanum pinnatisectum TaxID=50273 RepID=A0AAV9MKH1_9SOLN|nr:hypothetical protein R3W88_002200 [Solanum pinnatisectum]
MSSRNKKSQSEEVEELLRAAEDDVSLKLNLNSHMARGSSTQFIDPDLDQRFQALRSKQTPQKKPISQKGLDNQATLTTDESDDLLTRFAALKSSLPAYSSASSSAKQHAMVEDDDDDEVEKVIKWAIDAARLDPSPPSGTDDDDDDNNTTDEEDEGENSDDDFNRGHRKAKRK